MRGEEQQHLLEKSFRPAAMFRGNAIATDALASCHWVFKYRLVNSILNYFLLSGSFEWIQLEFVGKSSDSLKLEN